MDAERIIGRDREIAQLELAIGPGDDGLRLVLFSGPSGRGKTTLTREASRRATQRGFQIVAATGRAGSLSTPFAPWFEALPTLAAELSDSAGPHDVERVGAALTRTLVSLADDQPVLLICDDVQALDESSIALLPFASGLSERVNVTLLLVEQSDAVEVSDTYKAYVSGVLSRRLVNHIELGPMTDDSIAELAAEVLSIATDDVPTEIIVRAQGNPWFAQELAAAYGRGETEIPVNIAAAATARLHRLDEQAQDVVNAIALCHDGAYIGWLEALADQKPREFVRSMDRIRASGLVREDGEFLSIAHPLMQQALIEELSAAMRRALHQELADVIPGVTLAPVASARALGYHLACAGRTDEAVEQLLCAAEANDAAGQLHEALADFARCLEIEPRIEQRADLLRRAAFASMQLNDLRAGDYWAELARLAAATTDNELYAHALYQQYWTAQEGTAIDRLERAAALGSERFGWSARAAATLCVLEGAYEQALSHDERALQLARDNGDRMLETLTLEKLGWSYSYLGRFAEAIDCLRQAVKNAITDRLHSWAVFSWGALGENLAYTLDSRESLSTLRSALKYADDLNLIGLRPWVLGWLALALLRCGDVQEALEVSEQALLDDATRRDEQLQAFASMVRANITAQAGDTAACGRIVPDAIEITSRQGFASWMFEASFFRSYHLAQLGAVDEAVAFLDGPLINEPMALAGVAQWLVRLGACEGRDDLLGRAAELARGVDSAVPLVDLMLEEIECTVDAFERGGTDALCGVADRWAEVGRPLDAYRTLLSLALVDGRHGRKEQAIERLRQLRANFLELGVEHDANVISAQLRALGARSRARSRSTTVGNLTRRELEIARLVASGMKNAEVAQQLFLAEKTVAAHLSNIYGKVEVKSRVQLAAWLKQHDDDVVVA